jgi:WD40 repeat protein
MKGFVPVAGIFNMVTFPRTPSAFVAVTGKMGFKEIKEIWDLAAGRKVGALEPPGGSGDFALSPDGKYFAGRTGFGPQGGIEIWSTSDGQSINKVAVEGLIHQVAVTFLPDDLILTSSGTHNDVNFQVRELRTGKVRQQIQGVKDVEAKLYAISPGGKHLAVPRRDGKRVLVFDLSSGAQVGDAMTPLDRDFSHPNPTGVAFSPDGKSLAALFQFAFKYRLCTWEMGTGKGKLHPQLVHEEGGMLGMGYEGHPLEWLGDSSCLIAFGQFFLDPTSGKLVWNLPKKFGDNSPRRVFGTTKVASVKGEFNNRQLIVEDLPRDQLDTALAASRAGKDPAASDLPDAVRADTAAVRQLAAPVGAAAWAAQPDPAPAARGALGAQPIPVSGKHDEVQRIVFTSPDAGQAVIVRVQGDGASPKQPLFADRYDLAGGKALGSTKLFSFQAPKNRPQNLLADLSRDGNRVLVREPREERRVDVWSLSEGKHVAGWLPAEKEGDGRVQWAGFVDPGRVLTQSAAGKLTLWTIPDCRAVWSMDNIRSALALSPGGKYLALYTGATYELFDPASGDRKGQLEGNDIQGVDRATFRSDGKALAAAIRTPTGSKLRRWDLETGKVLPGGAPFRGIPNEFVWCSNDQLLAAAVLYDLNLGVPLTLHNLPGLGKVAADSIDGRVWFVFQRQPADPLVLNAQTLPDAAAKQLAAQLGDKTIVPVLGPGTQVSVRIDGGAAPNPQEFRDRALQAATNQLQANGFQVAAGAAPIHLVIQYGAPRNTGHVTEYRPIGPGGGQVTRVPVMEVPLRAALTDERGTQLWEHKNKMQTPEPFGIIRTEDVQKHVNDMLWNNCANWAGSLPLPGTLIRTARGMETLPRAVPLTGDR